MKIKLEIEQLAPTFRALLSSTPVTACRHDFLGLLITVLDADAPVFAANLRTAAEPLCAELAVDSVHDVWEGLVALAGRPPRAVIDALRSPDMVSTVSAGLDCLGYLGLSDVVASWGPQEYGDMATVPLTEDRRIARRALINQLRQRTQEIITQWREWKVELGPGPLRVDGRSMASAARVWQVPSITGSLGPVPTAPSALYANRLGRSAAAVAFARMNAAVESVAPDSWVFEPLALLVAVGEAVSPAQWRPGDAKAALHGQIPVVVRCGMPVTEETLDPAYWWPILSAWGATARRASIAVPTAWRLSEVQADVLLWALCSSAARLAVASTAPRRKARAVGGLFDWAGHVAKELPVWETGALSVWTLMQRGRQVQRRTAWPLVTAPVLKDAASWPWRSDSLGGVPDTEETP